MKVTIPDCYIKDWKYNLEQNGFESPKNEKEWVETIVNAINKVLGEDQFEWNDWDKKIADGKE